MKSHVIWICQIKSLLLLLLLLLNTFGQKAVGSNLREVVHVDLVPVGGGKISSFEAIVVSEISQVHNEHLEIARNDYLHLANIWFSDVSQKREELEIDILIG
jgi:hypothetical protein